MGVGIIATLISVSLVENSLSREQVRQLVDQGRVALARLQRTRVLIRLAHEHTSGDHTAHFVLIMSLLATLIVAELKILFSARS